MTDVLVLTAVWVTQLSIYQNPWNYRLRVVLVRVNYINCVSVSLWEMKDQRAPEPSPCKGCLGTRSSLWPAFGHLSILPKARWPERTKGALETSMGSLKPQAAPAPYSPLLPLLHHHWASVRAWHPGGRGGCRACFPHRGRMVLLSSRLWGLPGP